jgi:hypothetical protein
MHPKTALPRKRQKRQSASRIAMPFAFFVWILSPARRLGNRQVFLAGGKSFLTFWADVLELGIALREHIALDDLGIL